MKTAFVKGYANYTDQIYKVKQVLEDKDPVVYKIEDYFGNEIKGYFYEQEL
ncbi:hypothetical protein AAVH_43269, partial [Aphelenchoides avenae]